MELMALFLHWRERVILTFLQFGRGLVFLQHYGCGHEWWWIKFWPICCLTRWMVQNTNNESSMYAEQNTITKRTQSMVQNGNLKSILPLWNAPNSLPSFQWIIYVLYLYDSQLAWQIQHCYPNFIQITYWNFIWITTVAKRQPNQFCILHPTKRPP